MSNPLKFRWDTYRDAMDNPQMCLDSQADEVYFVEASKKKFGEHLFYWGVELSGDAIARGQSDLEWTLQVLRSALPNAKPSIGVRAQTPEVEGRMDEISLLLHSLGETDERTFISDDMLASFAAEDAYWAQHCEFHGLDRPDPGNNNVAEDIKPDDIPF